MNSTAPSSNLENSPPSGLIITKVSKAFGQCQVLKGISLESRPGRITALIGRNGSGKTTLFNILVGLLQADMGQATIDGVDLLGQSLQKRAKVGLGFLPQGCSSFPELSVGDNLRALIELFALSPAETRDRVGELLSLTGISHLHDRLYINLSTGEKRRLEIAKAFVARPPYLLLDEPFSGLDPCIVEEIAIILRQMANTGVGILITDHNAHTLVKTADYAYLLADGTIPAQGPPKDLQTDKLAKRLYFGQEFEAR